MDNLCSQEKYKHEKSGKLPIYFSDSCVAVSIYQLCATEEYVEPLPLGHV